VTPVGETPPTRLTRSSTDEEIVAPATGFPIEIEGVGVGDGEGVGAGAGTGVGVELLTVNDTGCVIKVLPY